MKFLVKRVIKKNEKVFYVSDTHTFDLKGNQIITLTDIKEYAQEFNIEEASIFIKNNRDFVLEESVDEFEFNETNLEVEDEEDE